MTLWMYEVRTSLVVFAFLVVCLFGFVYGDMEEKEVRHGNISNLFAVELPVGFDPLTIEKRHGVSYIRSMVGREEIHIFRLPHKDYNPFFDQSEDIRWFQRQTTHQRVKRDIQYNDPLFQQQWHLQDIYYGTDLNVIGAWEMDFTGAGILVAVIDDGFDHTSLDFERFVAAASYDVADGDNDPFPFSYDVHGTEVAGTIGAIGNNTVCGVGVAPGVSLAGIRLLAGDPADFEEAECLSFANDIVDIYSNSWGPYDDAARLEGPGLLSEAAILSSVDIGRQGKGSIYVWASGNGKASNDNCNYDGYANMRETVTIGAVGRSGISAYYSEPCAALIACAPSSDRNGNYIVTTGPGTDCEMNFGGTSAACPQGAGVVALCLEANPELTWRDVQGVLIYSSRLTDPTDTDWYENGAGLVVNHKYGFGILDAMEAVLTALEWENMPPVQQISSGTLDGGNILEDTIIGDNIESHILRMEWKCTENIIVEHVNVFFDASHAMRGDITITLVSPMGTSSLLATCHNDRNPNIIYWRYMTIRNWAENSKGVWTLLVTDCHINGHEGVVNLAEIVVYGHEGSLTHTLGPLPTSTGDGDDDEDPLPSFSASYFHY